MVWHYAREEPRIRGFICGCERAPTTGTPHLQGYLELADSYTLKRLLEWPVFKDEIDLHHSVRLSVAKGTAEQNKTYIVVPTPSQMAL